MPKKRIMTSPKRTFEEWEKVMTQKILDVREARRLIVDVIFSTPLRQTAQEKVAPIDGLDTLERQLSGELHRARRKHSKRQKTMCQCCGENRASWRTESGQYLCTGCACSRNDVRTRVPKCECCGRPLYGVTAGWRDDDTTLLYCSVECALKGRGCEPMTEKEEDGR